MKRLILLIPLAWGCAANKATTLSPLGAGDPYAKPKPPSAYSMHLPSHQNQIPSRPSAIDTSFSPLGEGKRSSWKEERVEKYRKYRKKFDVDGVALARGVALSSPSNIATQDDAALNLTAFVNSPQQLFDALALFRWINGTLDPATIKGGYLFKFSKAIDGLRSLGRANDSLGVGLDIAAYGYKNFRLQFGGSGKATFFQNEATTQTRAFANLHGGVSVRGMLGNSLFVIWGVRGHYNRGKVYEWDTSGRFIVKEIKGPVLDFALRGGNGAAVVGLAIFNVLSGMAEVRAVHDSLLDFERGDTAHYHPGTRARLGFALGGKDAPFTIYTDFGWILNVVEREYSWTEVEGGIYVPFAKAFYFVSRVNYNRITRETAAFLGVLAGLPEVNFGVGAGSKGDIGGIRPPTYEGGLKAGK